MKEFCDYVFRYQTCLIFCTRQGLNKKPNKTQSKTVTKKRPSSIAFSWCEITSVTTQSVRSKIHSVTLFKTWRWCEVSLEWDLLTRMQETACQEWSCDHTGKELLKFKMENGKGHSSCNKVIKLPQHNFKRWLWAPRPSKTHACRPSNRPGTSALRITASSVNSCIKDRCFFCRNEEDAWALLPQQSKCNWAMTKA